MHNRFQSFPAGSCNAIKSKLIIYIYNTTIQAIELERLAAIGPEEFIQTFVRGNDTAVLTMTAWLSHIRNRSFLT